MGNPYIPPEVIDGFWSWLKRRFSPSAIPEAIYGPVGSNVQRQTAIPTAYNAAGADVLPARPAPPAPTSAPPVLSLYSPGARQAQEQSGRANARLAAAEAAKQIATTAQPMGAMGAGMVQDLGQSFGTVIDPNASTFERALAAGNLALAAIPLGGPEAKAATRGAEEALAAAENPVHGMLSKLQAGEGFTLDPRAGMKPFSGSGYLVADPSMTATGIKSSADIEAFLVRPDVSAALERPNTFVGGWGDEVNISHRIADRQHAIQLGERRAQKAIGRIENGVYAEEIPLSASRPALDLGPEVPIRQPDFAQQRADPIVAAAVQGPDGKIYQGANHGEAANALEDAGFADAAERYRRSPSSASPLPEGFVTKSGAFVTRAELQQELGRRPVAELMQLPHPATEPALANAPVILPAQRERLIHDRIMGALAEDRQGLLATKASRRTASQVYQAIPTEPLMAGAIAGVAKRGWYKNTAHAIVDSFGPDAPRFAALLASLSPQTSVEENLKSAIQIWNLWREMPVPMQRDPAALRDLFVAATGRAKEMEARIPNAIRALTADDPIATVLSGPKVDAFRMNLLGDVQHGTLDTWMAKGADIPQSMFSGRSPTKAMVAAGHPANVSVAPPGYLAYEARLAETAAELTRATGKQWTVPEVQETVWSWLKATEEGTSVAATPDFAGLMNREPYSSMLKQGGLPTPVKRPLNPAPVEGPDAKALRRLGENLRRFNRGEFLRFPKNERGVVGIPEAIGTGIPVEMPAHPQFENAVRNTPGAKITPQGLEVDVQRFQAPEQAGTMSARRGVFYLPAGANEARWFRGGSPNVMEYAGKQVYGGAQEVTGRTLFRKPLFVHGSVGGPVPENALRQLVGKDRAKQILNDVQVFHMRYAYNAQFGPTAQEIASFLEAHGGRPEAAYEMVRNHLLGNRLRYALQENIIAAEARRAGYDGIIGYNSAWGNPPKIREIFDIREGENPIPGKPMQPTMRVGGQPDLFNTQGRGALPMLAGAGAAAGAAFVASEKLRRRRRRSVQTQ